MTFQPGVRIDWGRRQVEVDGAIVLREGYLELFACSPGTREHESIVCIQGRPLHVYHALGLLGLEAGHPMRFNAETNRIDPAAGDPVEIEIRFEAEGQTRTEPIERWMRHAGTKKPLEVQEWVFAGSVPIEGQGAIEADLEGTVIAIVDFPTALVALPEEHSDRNAELWLEPATEAIPPIRTPCTLIFRQGPLRLSLDAAGHLQLGGKPSTMSAAAQAVRQAVEENPMRRVHVVINPDAPRAERNLLRRLLDDLRVPADQLTIEERKTSSRRPHDPRMLVAWLDGRFTSPQPIGDKGLDWAHSTRRLMDDLRSRNVALRAKTETATQYVHQTTGDLRRLLAPQSAPAYGNDR